MDWKGLFKEWKVWMLIIFVCGAIAGIGPHYEQNGNGDISIAINLNKGIDLGGGAEVVARPKNRSVSIDKVEDAVSTLEDRFSTSAGLQSVKVNQEGKSILVQKPGVTVSQLKDLINSTGNFEARIPIEIGKNEELKLGVEKYSLEIRNKSIEIRGKKYGLNSSLELSPGPGKNKISLKILDIEENKTTLSALVFNGDGVVEEEVPCKFCDINEFPIIITSEATGNLEAITQALEEGHPRCSGKPQYGDDWLSSKLKLYVDGKNKSELCLPDTFKKGDISTEIRISVGGGSRKEIREEKDRIKAILNSGALPIELVIERSAEVTASEGQEVTQSAFIALFLGVAAVSVVIFTRYKDPKIALPILITGLSEILVLLSLYSSGNVLYSSIAIAIPTLVGILLCFRKNPISLIFLGGGSLFIFILSIVPATLDLVAVAGIVAAIGTGVDDQVIITDEGASKKIKSLRARIKRAFFIIFTSAASTIGAMLPLLRIGFGYLRGFATATIVGVLVGITVTRPAYAKVLEYIE